MHSQCQQRTAIAVRTLSILLLLLIGISLIAKENINHASSTESESQWFHATPPRWLYAWQTATPYSDPNNLCAAGSTGYRATVDCSGYVYCLNGFLMGGGAEYESAGSVTKCAAGSLYDSNLGVCSSSMSKCPGYNGSSSKPKPNPPSPKPPPTKRPTRRPRIDPTRRPSFKPNSLLSGGSTNAGSSSSSNGNTYYTPPATTVAGPPSAGAIVQGSLNNLPPSPANNNKWNPPPFLGTPRPTRQQFTRPTQQPVRPPTNKPVGMIWLPANDATTYTNMVNNEGENWTPVAPRDPETRPPTRRPVMNWVPAPDDSNTATTNIIVTNNNSNNNNVNVVNNDGENWSTPNTGTTTAGVVDFGPILTYGHKLAFSGLSNNNLGSRTNLGAALESYLNYFYSPEKLARLSGDDELRSLSNVVIEISVTGRRLFGAVETDATILPNQQWNVRGKQEHSHHSRDLQSQFTAIYDQRTTYRTSDPSITIDAIIRRPFENPRDTQGLIQQLQQGDPNTFYSLNGIDFVGGINDSPPKADITFEGDPAKRFCGYDWNDVRENCLTAIPCPQGYAQGVCPSGTKCIADTPCWDEAYLDWLRDKQPDASSVGSSNGGGQNAVEIRPSPSNNAVAPPSQPTTTTIATSNNSNNSNSIFRCNSDRDCPTELQFCNRPDTTQRGYCGMCLFSGKGCSIEQVCGPTTGCGIQQQGKTKCYNPYDLDGDCVARLNDSGAKCNMNSMVCESSSEGQKQTGQQQEEILAAPLPADNSSGFDEDEGLGSVAKYPNPEGNQFFCGITYAETKGQCLQSKPCPNGFASHYCDSKEGCFLVPSCTVQHAQSAAMNANNSLSPPTPNLSRQPTRPPTKNPTQNPSNPPSRHPTPNPSRQPTVRPTQNPTRPPTKNPTPNPSNPPIRDPTWNPSRQPSARPTQNPTPNQFLQPVGPTTQSSSFLTFYPTPKSSSKPTPRQSADPTTQTISFATFYPTPKFSTKPTLRQPADPTTPNISFASFFPTPKSSGKPTPILILNEPVDSIISTSTNKPDSYQFSKPDQQPALSPSSKLNQQPEIVNDKAVNGKPATPVNAPKQAPSGPTSSSPSKLSSSLSSQPARQPTSSSVLMPTKQEEISKDEPYKLFPVGKPARPTLSISPDVGPQLDTEDANTESNFISFCGSAHWNELLATMSNCELATKCLDSDDCDKGDICYKDFVCDPPSTPAATQQTTASTAMSETASNVLPAPGDGSGSTESNPTTSSGSNGSWTANANGETNQNKPKSDQTSSAGSTSTENNPSSPLGTIGSWSTNDGSGETSQTLPTTDQTASTNDISSAEGSPTTSLGSGGTNQNLPTIDQTDSKEQALAFEPCSLCGSSQLDWSHKVKFEGNDITCGDFRWLFLSETITEDSDQCLNFRDQYFDDCCHAEYAGDGCDLCGTGTDGPLHDVREDVFLQVDSEEFSCSDLSTWARTSFGPSSEQCVDTKNKYFNDCCFEKCSLCGDSNLDWEAMLVYSGEEVSCHELDSKIFIDEGFGSDSSECEFSKNLYAETCCIRPPEKPCNLCRLSNGDSFNMNTNALVSYNGEVETCLEVHHFLNSRREQSSEHCMDAQGALFGECCEAVSSRTIPEDSADDASPSPTVAVTTLEPTPRFENWHTYSLRSSASTIMVSLWLFCLPFAVRLLF